MNTTTTTTNQTAEFFQMIVDRIDSFGYRSKREGYNMYSSLDEEGKNNLFSYMYDSLGYAEYYRILDIMQDIERLLDVLTN